MIYKFVKLIVPLTPTLAYSDNFDELMTSPVG